MAGHAHATALKSEMLLNRVILNRGIHSTSSGKRMSARQEIQRFSHRRGAMTSRSSSAKSTRHISPMQYLPRYKISCEGLRVVGWCDDEMPPLDFKRCEKLRLPGCRRRREASLS